MLCSDNDFCRSLTKEMRARLCKGCRKRSLKAGSLEVFDQIVDKTFIVLDGVCVSSMSDPNSNPHETALPLYSFCLPGRVLSQDILLDLPDRPPMPYISMDCLTDCVVATFEHRFILEMYDHDPHFARKVNESAVRIMYDISIYAGIMRTESAYAKVVLFLRHLLRHRLFLSNNHIAQVLACDRTTVSRAISRAKKEQPALWEAYHANKHRRIEAERG